MCGIVGYVGPQEVVPVILEGLRRLEYRKLTDSAGIAVGRPAQGNSSPDKLEIRRAPGKLKNIEEVLRQHPLHGTYGIGHTRWATHGRPTEENAHPHRDCTGRIVVVHNGIVENYLELKRELTAQGHIFVTETDTEIIAHLIEQVLKESSPTPEAGAPAPAPGVPSDRSSSLGWQTWVPTIPLEEAVRKAVKRLTGAFALGVLSSLEPDKIVAARSGPPVVIGIGEGEYFVASDVPGILHHTRNIVFLNDGEMAILTLAGVEITDFDGRSLPVKPQRILWDPIQAEKGGYKHFMLKEIWEQPRAIRDTTLGRISLDTGKVFLDEMGISPQELAQATSINIAACGTSWHAATAGKYMIERLARVPVDVDYASEYRYRDRGVQGVAAAEGVVGGRCQHHRAATLLNKAAGAANDARDGGRVVHYHGAGSGHGHGAAERDGILEANVTVPLPLNCTGLASVSGTEATSVPLMRSRVPPSEGGSPGSKVAR